MHSSPGCAGAVLMREERDNKVPPPYPLPPPRRGNTPRSRHSDASGRDRGRPGGRRGNQNNLLGQVSCELDRIRCKTAGRDEDTFLRLPARQGPDKALDFRTSNRAFPTFCLNVNDTLFPDLHIGADGEGVERDGAFLRPIGEDALKGTHGNAGRLGDWLERGRKYLRVEGNGRRGRIANASKGNFLGDFHGLKSQIFCARILR